MTKQNIEIRQACIVCNDAATQACVNCQVAHCPQHLVGRSCAGCSGQLWILQAKHLRWIGVLYALLAIPIFTFSMFFGGPDLTYAFVMPGLVLGSFALPKLSRPLLKRITARRALSPTSKPMQLAPHTEAATDPVVESDYDKRRRNNGPGSSKTSVLGSFYKI